MDQVSDYSVVESALVPGQYKVMRLSDGFYMGQPGAAAPNLYRTRELAEFALDCFKSGMSFVWVDDGPLYKADPGPV